MTRRIKEMPSTMFKATPNDPRLGKGPLNAREYQRLLGRTLPHVIRTEAENEHYVELLAQFDARSDRMSPADKELADLLTLLIEDFEEQHYALKAASPVEVLRELMRANNLKQKDLMDVFGTPNIASEVIKGKCNFTTDHIRKLSQRFHVSPELFL
jgi:HTH-type transcriptional regulator/antitoxin HigA